MDASLDASVADARADAAEGEDAEAIDAEAIDAEPRPDAGPGAIEHTAEDIATAAVYSRLTFEIDSVPGFEPRSDALQLLRDRMDELVAGGWVGKPDGVFTELDGMLPAAPANHVYTLAELIALADAHRSLARRSGEAIVHMLYVDGGYEGDGPNGTVLGFAFGHDLIVMFRRSIDDACDDPLQPLIRDAVCRILEGTVLVHEAGHILGLVDNGVAEVNAHEDTAHPKHDVDDGCVMYYVAETSGYAATVVNEILGGTEQVKPFDAACLADLAAAQ